MSPIRIYFSLAILVCSSSLNAADIIFKDTFDRPGVIPPASEVAIAETSPQLGSAYTGKGVIWNTLQATGALREAGEALGGKNFVESTNGGFDSVRAHINSADQVLVTNSIATFTFDFYMAGGSRDIIVTTYRGSGDDKNVGPGWHIFLCSDGAIKWWDGVVESGGETPGIHEVGTFDLGKKVSSRIIADYSQGTFKAVIGEVSFEGTFPSGTTAFENLIFYNSGGVEFFFNNLEIACGTVE